VAKKPYAKMTDKELVRKLFPKHVRKQLKTVLSELNAERKPAKKQRKS
jgi:hypothetical protein